MRFNTIIDVASGEYKSRGSKFFSFLHPISNFDEYKHLISIYRSRYPEACHVCSAYRLFVHSRIDEKGVDDGEPRGSSGQPILNQLKRNNLINVGAYVIRIFGGTLLGIPGLIESYSNSTLISIDNAVHTDWFPQKHVIMQTPYDQQRIVESIIKEFNATILNRKFSECVYIEISLNKNNFELFNQKIKDISSGKISLQEPS